MGYYDKVYCGASVPPEESEFLKSLINVQFLFANLFVGKLKTNLDNFSVFFFFFRLVEY